jgi:phospholipase C
MQQARQRWIVALTLTAMLSGPGGGPLAALAQAAQPDRGRDTETPIKHVIVLIGENRTFDHTFGTYRPQPGQTVANLVSKGIIDPDGAPGPQFAQSQQFQVTTPLPAHYFISVDPSAKTPYTPFLPTPELGGAPHSPSSLTALQADPTGVQPPFDPTISDGQLAANEPALEPFDLALLRTGATGATSTTGLDVRITNATTLPNGVFPLTGPQLPYDAYM